MERQSIFHLEKPRTDKAASSVEMIELVKCSFSSLFTSCGMSGMRNNPETKTTLG